MQIKVSIMVSGSVARSREKECIFIPILMYFQAIGTMEKNKEQAHMYLQRQP